MTNLTIKAVGPVADLPAALPARQDAFCISDSTPIATSGLSGCLGLIIHDPHRDRGALAHLTNIGDPPSRHDVEVADTIISSCYSKLSLTRDTAEFFLCNGGQQWDDFLKQRIGKSTAGYDNVYN